MQGLGATLPVLLLLMVDRPRGWTAVAVTTAFTVGVVGVLCNLLCYSLDVRLIHFVGGAKSPTLFIVNSIVMAAFGGFEIGWLLLVPIGQR